MNTDDASDASVPTNSYMYRCTTTLVTAVPRPRLQSSGPRIPAADLLACEDEGDRLRY